MNHCLSPGRAVKALFLVLLAAPTSVWGAEGVTLKSGRKPGDLDAVATQLEVGGTLKLVGEEGVKSLKMHATGVANYHEKLLTKATGKWDGLRLLRQYAEAKAAIQVEEATTRPQLRDERKTVAVAGVGSAVQMFGIDGPLTRDELELVDAPFNTAVVDELLPATPVKVGDHWEHQPELAAALLGLDAAGVCELKSTLNTVDEAAATMSLAGNVEGAINGVSTRILVKANYRFDRKMGRVTFVGALLKENRSIGHVGPGMEVTAKYQAKISPNAKNEALEAYQDAAALKDLMPEYSLLEYVPSLKNYRALYDHRWFVMTDEPNLVTMRMVDRGELLAQVKISTPTGVSHDQPATIDAFQSEIEKSLAEEFGQFTSATTMENSLGVVTHRVTVRGVVQELPIEWRYYLLVSPAGKEVVVAFTLEEKAMDRFGAADEQLVESLEFLGDAAEPATARTRLQLK